MVCSITSVAIDTVNKVVMKQGSDGNVSKSDPCMLLLFLLYP